MLRWVAIFAFAPAASLAAVVAVNEPWVRPAATGSSTEAFMEIAVSEDAMLVDVRTPLATRIALAQGRERRPAPFALSLAAGKPLLMDARATRIVLGRVERPLKLRDRVPLTLVLRYADGTTQEIPVDAEVRRRSPSEDHGHPH